MSNKTSPPPRPKTASHAQGSMSSPAGNSLFGKGRGYPATPPPLHPVTSAAAPGPGTPGTPPPITGTPPPGMRSAGVSPGMEKLEQVKASLATLNSSLHSSAAFPNIAAGGSTPGGKKAPQTGESRLMEMKDSTARIEQHVALEVKRRAEGDAKIQGLIEIRAREIAQQLEKKVTDRLVAMHHAVDALTKRVGQLNAELALEREKNVRLTQELKYHAAQGLTDMKQAVDQERIQRQEKEALMSKKLGEDVFRMQERLDVERHAREVMLSAVKEDIGSLQKRREKGDERFLKKLREDIAALRKQLGTECETRQRSEEHLAKTMEDIVQQMQSSLAVMSSAHNR